MQEMGGADNTYDSSYVQDYIDVRDEVVKLHGWTHTPDEMWCHVTPPGHLFQAQGWKIHLSATPRSAVAVLQAAARVLLREQVPFKFAKGLSQLRTLLSVRCDRGAGGKFMTIYPKNNEEFAALLEPLHAATEGMDGPGILSDRRLRPGSLVHYRYGGFSSSQQVLDGDGSLTPMLVAPDGQWFKDQRLAWYSPPSWASAPIPDPTPRPAESQRGTSKVLLNDRFVVSQAIRHSNRGGVYRGVDQTTGETVVLKEARPHVAAELDGSDARDFLRNEYETLRMLEPLRIAPRPVAFFEYQGHSFLAEEEIPGITLREWADQRVRQNPLRYTPLDRLLPLARQLVELVAAVHDKGLVFRDLTSNNVMVMPGEKLMIIDTEFLAEPGQQVTRVMTMSYTAPEELSGPPRYPAPGPTADLYSLGATLFHLATGAHALMTPDNPPPVPGAAPTGPVRPLDDRIDLLLTSFSAANPTLAILAPVVRGLMRADPTERLSLHRVREILDDLDDLDGVTNVTASIGEPLRLPTVDQHRLLEDGRRQILTAMTPAKYDYLWPAYPIEGRWFDALSVQAGCAGTVEVLRRTLAVTGDDEVRDCLRTAVRWMDRGLTRPGRVLPGLYFGRAGTHWATYDAAVDLGEEDIARRTVESVKRLPVKWGNPDITHGVAGGGLAQLHLWLRTDDDDLRERVGICVDSVLAARTSEEGLWPMGPLLGERTAGMTHYGFAHGVAGVCAFLLAVARELDRTDLMETVLAGGDLLLTLEDRHGDGSLWPVAQREAEASARFDGVCWWCSGAGGVGTFLIRLWHATGDERYRRSAHRAAVAARAEKWLLGSSHCHGLAGNGEFLLDMAAATGDDTYRGWAEEYAQALYRLCALRENRLVPMDDGGVQVTYSYNLGLSGPVGFLHRLRHGGPRWWMVDDFAATPARSS